MTETINNQLDILFEEWKTTMEKNGDRGFCYDGLIYRQGKEDVLWKQSSRRILFLLKEQNDNDGEDVREWTGSINGVSPNGNFFNRLSAWLYGLTHITSSTYPPLSEAFDTTNQMKALREYPYAYVNLKKETGGAVASDSVVYDHASLYRDFLRRQLDILNPTIIVCGGEVVFRAARDLIFPDRKLEPVGDGGWVHICKRTGLMVINSFHPTAHKTNEVMYEWMMREVKLHKNIN